MEIEKHNLLVNTLNSKRYFMKLRDNSIFDRKERKYIDIKKMSCGLETVQLVYNDEENEFGMFEVISVWLRIYIINMKCNFIDRNKGNCHFSNIVWLDPRAKYAMNNKHKQGIRYSLEKEEIEFIKNVKMDKNRTNKISNRDLALMFNVPLHKIHNIRSGHFKKINLPKQN